MDRIEELAKEAGYEVDMFGLGHFDMPEFRTFVKLLIKECSSLTLDYKNDEYYDGWMDYRELINKHFGVEE